MIKINLTKAKEIAHNIRRYKRDEEFLPVDSLIAKQLPSNDFKKLEAERQKIRNKYSTIQTKIDYCEHVEELENINKAL